MREDLLVGNKFAHSSSGLKSLIESCTNLEALTVDIYPLERIAGAITPKHTSLKKLYLNPNVFGFYVDLSRLGFIENLTDLEEASLFEVNIFGHCCQE